MAWKENESKVGYEKTWKYEVIWGNENKLEETSLLIFFLSLFLVLYL